MHTPLTTSIRTTPGFLRSVAALVIVTFTGLILQPTALALQTLPAKANKSQTAADTNSAKLARANQKLLEKLERTEAKLARNETATAELAELKALQKELTTLDTTAMQEFADIEKHLKARKLPPVILKRHRDAVATYRQEMDTVLTNLTATDKEKDATLRTQKLKQTKDHLKATKHQRSHQPFDPNHLPNKTLRPKPNNKPKTNKAAFTAAGLVDTPYAQLAALGDYTFDRLPGASDPAYLAATDEITLSDAIATKAAELNHDPVAIYHWVLNNTQWQPAWGAMQDADLTLAAQRGNSMDIASLLIALLRASGIPARYVHGTLDIPADQFNNWAGGFSDINAAIDYAASGGIPVTPITRGGQITKVRIEHLWVEAAIDYQPSRGAKNKAADSWVPMDPSYKQYEILPGLDVIQIAGIDPEQLAQDVVDSGTINETEGWVTGFNPAILQSAQTQAQTALEDYITNNLTDPTVGDVIGGKRTIVQQFPVLPSALPNKIVTDGVRYGALPEALQQKISFDIGAGTVTYPYARLNNQKITLSFDPATPDDEAALLALLPEGDITDISQLPSSIPAYLINVIPELKRNDTVIKTGSPMTLGQEIDFRFDTQLVSHGTVPNRYAVIAGSYLSIAVIGQNVSSTRLTNLQSQLEQTKTILESNNATQIAALTREHLLGDMFHAGVLGYYAQLLALSRIAGLQQGGHHLLMAGLGSVGYEPNVDTFFGIPRAITAGGIALNIPYINVTSVDGATAEDKKNFTLQIGLLSSALEHAVPEQMFAADANNPPDAVSTVKALSKASQQGQRIYHITSANKTTTLPNIHHDASTMAEINAALQVGKEVITHTDAISVPGWSGAGYVIFDPVTGEGAYKIGGGQNGGWLIIAAFVIIAALIVFSLFTGNFIAAAFLVWQFWKFTQNVKHIAATADTEEDAVNELNRLLFLTTVSVALTLVGPFGKLLKEGKLEYSPFAFLAGFTSIFSTAWYS